MRDPTVNSSAAAEEQRATGIAKEYLYWVLVSDRRWADSRWSGQSPRDEWEQEFRYTMGVAQKIINDPECDSLLRKYAPYIPAREARKAITTWLARASPPPPPRKKKKAKQMNTATSGELREQTNALRNQHIAYAVALVRRNYEFNVKLACSIVAKAVCELRLTGEAPRSTKRVTTIWGKYRRLVSSDD